MAFRALMAAAVVSLLSVLPACQSAPNNGSSQGPFQPIDVLEVSRVGLKQRWTHSIGLANGETLTKAWRVGDAVYVTTSRSFIVAIDASTGVRRWSLDLATDAQEIFRPVESPDKKSIIVCNKGKVAALDKMSGKLLALNSLGFFATTDPFIVDNTLCIGGPNYFYGLFLDPFAGRKWVTAAPSDYFISRPAQIGTSSLIVASGKAGKVWRLNPQDGDWDWRDRKVGGPVIAPLAADARFVYVPSLDGRVYAFDLATSSHMWDTRLEGKLNLAPVPASPSVVLCPTTGGGLFALSADKGQIKWTMPGVEKIGTIQGDRAYLLDASGNLLTVLIDTGEVLSTLKLPGAKDVITNRTDNYVVTIFHDGRIVSFEQNR